MGDRPLWAAWKMEYILGEKEKGCTFCRILADGPALKGENLVLSFHGDHYVVMNRYPYNNGHVMVVPNRHVQRLSQLTPAETGSLFERVRLLEGLLTGTLACQGLNVGINLGKAAGAGIEEHLHVHLVPRWEGDTNYMTSVGGLRVIVEHIRVTYGKLLDGLRGSDEQCDEGH